MTLVGLWINSTSLRVFCTTRVVVRSGLIVGFRALITAGKQQVKDKTPVHIADVQSMTEEFLQRLQKRILLVTTMTQVVVSRRWVRELQRE